MASNTVYVQGSYVDIHDNEVVNLSIDKAGKVSLGKANSPGAVAHESFSRGDHGVGSTDHFLKFLYYTSFLTPHDPTSKFST